MTSVRTFQSRDSWRARQGLPHLLVRESAQGQRGSKSEVSSQCNRVITCLHILICFRPGSPQQRQSRSGNFGSAPGSVPGVPGTYISYPPAPRRCRCEVISNSGASSRSSGRDYPVNSLAGLKKAHPNIQLAPQDLVVKGFPYPQGEQKLKHRPKKAQYRSLELLFTVILMFLHVR
jgi:hypothetical protein